MRSNKQYYNQQVLRDQYKEALRIFYLTDDNRVPKMIDMRCYMTELFRDVSNMAPEFQPEIVPMALDTIIATQQLVQEKNWFNVTAVMNNETAIDNKRFPFFDTQRQGGCPPYFDPATKKRIVREPDVYLKWNVPI